MRHVNLHILARMLGFDHVEALIPLLTKDDVLVWLHAEYPRYTAEECELLGFLHRNPEYRKMIEDYEPLSATYADIQNTLLCRCEL